MKKLLAILVLVLMGTISYAQWSGGTDIYNTNTGNVGIGTGVSFTPGYKLHVKTGTAGPATLMLESDVASGANGYFRITNTTTGHIANTVLRKNGANYEYIQSVYDPAGGGSWGEFLYFNFTNHKYEIRPGIVDAEFLNAGKLLFNNVGGVGIGVTTIPAGVKFAVNGKVNCKEVEVTLSGWSDYVFKKGYNLMPLSEVESFISSNKHLPGVPSESEVVGKTTNLGEMDAILLRKIEELTLYMIELKKDNDLLRNQIKNLK